MEWFNQKTSIAGMQISNWMLVIDSGCRRNLGLSTNSSHIEFFELGGGLTPRRIRAGLFF